MLVPMLIGGSIGIVLTVFAAAALFLRRRNEMETMETELAATRRNFRAAESKIEEVEDQLRDELTELDKAADALIEAKETVENEVIELRCELQALRTSTKTVVAANTKSLKKELEKEKTNVTQHLSRVETAESTIATLRSEKFDLETEEANLTLERSELESEVADLTKKLKKTIAINEELQKSQAISLEVLDEARKRTADSNTRARALEKLIGETFNKAEEILKPKPNTERRTATELNNGVPITGGSCSAPRLPKD